ncbi:MAG: hypothetical protein VX615_00415, partial [Planctomycetota bacterium]|nr:hypothetical protein [Planctomycetota bacterium]
HGDLEQALYWSNLSLRNSSKQPEMIRLRDQITGERESTWERDLLRELLLKESNQISMAQED